MITNDSVRIPCYKSLVQEECACLTIHTSRPRPITPLLIRIPIILIPTLPLSRGGISIFREDIRADITALAALEDLEDLVITALGDPADLEGPEVPVDLADITAADHEARGVPDLRWDRRRLLPPFFILT